MSLGRFSNVPVDLDGVCAVADFEFIELIDDSNPYPALLGIEWAMENAAVINFKERRMTFEGNELRVIVPLDPSQGERYTEPLRAVDQDDLEHIYNITAKEEDDEGSPTEGWESGSSVLTDFEDDLENWQNRLYVLKGHRCAPITKSLRWLGAQPNTLPVFDGSTDPDQFIVQFSSQIPES